MDWGMSVVMRCYGIRSEGWRNWVATGEELRVSGPWMMGRDWGIHVLAEGRELDSALAGAGGL
jgi:hypothetical protein